MWTVTRRGKQIYDFRSFEVNGGSWCCCGDAPDAWRRGPEDDQNSPFFLDVDVEAGDLGKVMISMKVKVELERPIKKNTKYEKHS